MRVAQFDVRAIGAHNTDLTAMAQELRDSLLADSSHGWIPIRRSDNRPIGVRIHMLLGTMVVGPNETVRLDWRLVDVTTSRVVLANSEIVELEGRYQLLETIREAVRDFFARRRDQQQQWGT